jgi:DNA-binding transcriptional ArsR family regulator
MSVAKPDVAVLQREAREGGRTVEQAVSHAIGHRTRIEILAALHEAPASPKELAKIVGQPLANVTHHIEKLFTAGSIDIAYTEPVGNVTQTFYRMVELPYYSNEDIAAMTEQERQVLAAIILQAVTAEAMASLWAGKLRSDPEVMLAWNRISLDEQGRREFYEEQKRSWETIMEIEVDSANRRSISGEAGVTYVVTSLGYERSRTEAPKPVATGKH